MYPASEIHLLHDIMTNFGQYRDNIWNIRSFSNLMKQSKTINISLDPCNFGEKNEHPVIKQTHLFDPESTVVSFSFFEC